MKKLQTTLAIAVIAGLALAAYMGMHAPFRSGTHKSTKSKEETAPLSQEKERDTAKIAPQEKTHQQNSYKAPQISISAEQALKDAHAITRCIRASNSNFKAPGDLTKEQKIDLEKSRIENLDCSALDSKYSAYELAKHAAEQGNTQAQLDFSALAASIFNEEKTAMDPRAISEYKEDSLRYLNMAAASGSEEALSRLAQNYQSGLFTEADRVKAYAYAYAYSQRKKSEISILRANQMASKLSPEEFLRGQSLGQSIASKKQIEKENF